MSVDVRILVAAPVALACALLTDCRDPTEITLVLSTDVPCSAWGNATIAAGAHGAAETASPGTTTAACDPSGALGTIVLVPSGARDESISIKIAGGDGRSAETCVAPTYGPGCIVQRRALHFIPHTPLRLAISLRRACAGVACNLDETCDPATARCTSSTIDAEQCNGGGCGDSALATPDGGAPIDASDDRPIEGDGAAPSDGSPTDGAPGRDGAVVMDAAPSTDGSAPDAGPAPIGTPCDASAQCATTCCCPTQPPMSFCDTKSGCTSEIPGGCLK